MSYLESESKPGVNAEALPASGEEKRLVALARNGSQRAMTELVLRCRDKAFAIAYHLCSGDRQDAEDFVQEAFLRAFRSLKRFRGDSSFSTWFYRILVNVCLDGKRRQHRWRRLFSPWVSRRKEENQDMDPGETQSDSLEAASNRQLSQGIHKAMQALPEKQRTAFQLKALQGMSIKEIAQVMDSAEGTVKSHLFRATRSLRQALKEWEEHEGDGTVSGTWGDASA